MSKLYDIPRNSYIRVSKQESENEEFENVTVPVPSQEVVEGEIIYFSHTDGMYSLCEKVNSETLEHGDTCHLAVWTEVELVDLDDLFGFEKIRTLIGRSGYGKDGQSEYRQSTLANMSDDWVNASIDFVDSEHRHRKFYIQELEYRKVNSIVIEDT